MKKDKKEPLAMVEEKQAAKQRSYLIVIIAFLCLTVLVIVFLFFGDASLWDKLIELGKSTIPNLIASLITVIAVYIVFFRQGISPVFPCHDLDTELVVKPISGLPQKNDTLFCGYLCKITVIKNYKEIKWGDVIFPGKTKTIDIVSCYQDHWFNAHWQMLLDFLESGGRIRLFIPDHNSQDILTIVKHRFAKNTEAEVKAKIEGTLDCVEKLARAAKTSDDNISCFVLPQAPNYAAMIVDDLLYLSVFEHSYDFKANSPCLCIPLKIYDYFRLFCERELEYFGKVSTKLPLHKKSSRPVRD